MVHHSQTEEGQQQCTPLVKQVALPQFQECGLIKIARSVDKGLAGTYGTSFALLVLKWNFP